jgi:hypothetical protein
MPAVVDDQSIEQSQGIHADADREFVEKLPLFENIHVGRCNTGI